MMGVLNQHFDQIGKQTRPNVVNYLQQIHFCTKSLETSCSIVSLPTPFYPAITFCYERTIFHFYLSITIKGLSEKQHGTWS